MKESGNDIDKGYAWVVLTAAFCIQMIAGILTYSPGVINIAILEYIENDLTKSSWIGSALFGTFTLLGPVAGLIQNRVGPRITALAGGLITLLGLAAASFCQTIDGFILTYGVLTGFGICLGGNVVGVVPGQYFVSRRPLAYGICASGGAMGLLISGPLIRYLLAEYGISGCLLLLGAVSFHMCITGVIFRNQGPVVLQTLQTDIVAETDSEKNGIKKNEEFSLNVEMCSAGRNEEYISDVFDDSQQKSTLEALNPQKVSGDKICVEDEDNATPRCCSSVFSPRVPNLLAFFIYNISICIWSLGESACMFHLPNYVEMKGSTLTQAANLFTAIGAGGLFSRSITGLIATDPNIGYTTLHVGFLGIASTVILLFPLYSHTYTLQLVYSVLYGIYNQGVNSLIAPITIDLIGLSNVAVGYGTVYFSSGIGYFLGPPIASVLYRVTGLYDFTFIFTGICFILSSISTAATSIFKRR